MVVPFICAASNSASTASRRYFSTSKLRRVRPFQSTQSARGPERTAQNTVSTRNETVAPAALVRRRVTTFGRRGARGRRERLLRALGRPREGSAQQVAATPLPSRRRAVVLSTTPFVGLVTRRRAGGASSNGNVSALQRGGIVKVRALDRIRGARKALVTLASGLASKKVGRNPQAGRAVQRFSTRLGRQLTALAGQRPQGSTTSSTSAQNTTRSSRDERHRQALRSLPSTRTRSI
jgi:hypothetical protein